MSSEISRYYIVKDTALPEVLRLVVEVKDMLARDRSLSVKAATERAGISRSTFYRYRDEVSPLNRELRGKTVNFSIRLEDKPGILSAILKEIAEHEGNILTIHQSVPIQGVALLTISLQILSDLNRIEEMLQQIEHSEGVYEVRLLGEG
ncbi:MAG: ACT domain-containing protein [Lachnospiraceae bacterium]|nr:ACT domain-containing protein [Lachnospiraceae bacterium]